MTVPVELFETVAEYVEQWPTMSDRKKRLRRTHPLVVFAETSLEQWAPHALKIQLFGLNESTRDVLLSVRGDLEDAAEPDSAAIALVFAYEQLCVFVPASNYTADEEEVQIFHRELVPELLNALAGWAAERDETLNSIASETLGAYAAEIGWDS